MELKDFVLENQKVIDLVKDRTGGNTQVDMYYGTLDYATARFHSILIELSQDKLKEQEHQAEVMNVQRYRFWPWIARPFIRMVLHSMGTRRIPEIKKLLNNINN